MKAFLTIHYSDSTGRQGLLDHLAEQCLSVINERPEFYEVTVRAPRDKVGTHTRRIKDSCTGIRMVCRL